MAITLDELKKKTRKGKGFNAPGAAENLRFLKDIFRRAEKTAAKDPDNDSLELGFKNHADMFEQLDDEDLVNAQEEKAEDLSVTLDELDEFKNYLKEQESWEDYSPLSYLKQVVCENEKERKKLDEAILSVDQVLELGIAPKKKDKDESDSEYDEDDDDLEKEDDEEEQEDDKEREDGDNKSEDSLLDSEDDDDIDPKTPEQYFKNLNDEANDIEIDPNEVDPDKEDLIKLVEKRLALKYREYGPFDADKVDEFAGKLNEVGFLNDWLAEKQPQQLKDIVRNGTDALERELKEEIIRKGELPEEHFWPISVNARDFTESVQSKLKGRSFRDMEKMEKVDEYCKILAARASVSAARNTFRGSALNKEMVPSSFTKIYEAIYDEDDPVNDALFKLIDREGDEKVRDWAVKGHGGALEDQVKLELRNMAKKDDYELPEVPVHFRPTVKERLQDIRDILKDDAKWSEMSPNKQKYLISEYALLQKEARMPGGMDAVLGDIKEHNAEAEAFSKSDRFSASVKDINQVRQNLANLNLDEAAEGFRRSQIEEPRKESTSKKQEDEPSLEESRSVMSGMGIGGFGKH